MNSIVIILDDGDNDVENSNVKRKNSTVMNVDDRKSEKIENIVDCPSCFKSIILDKMNEHLDQCLIK